MSTHSSNSPLGRGDSRNLVAQVYRALLIRLSSQATAMGEHIKAQQIADELSISKATARKAIRRLVQDGWLVTGDNGRPTVAVRPPAPVQPEEPAPVFTNLTEQVYRTVLEEALERKHAGGDVLKAKPLAERLGVSLQTVREALDWLCRDGVLQRLPRRGWQVSKVELADVQTMFDIRRQLEPMVIRRAIHRIDDDTIDELLIETEDLIERPHATRTERLRAEVHFHEALLEAAEDQVLADVLRPLIRKMMFVVSVTHGLSRSSFPQHLRILNALEARDEEQAVQHIRRDLANPLDVNFIDWD